MGLGVLDHAIDLFVGQTGAVLDLDRVLLAGGLVLRGHGHDAVGVDVEGDLDLRHTTRSRCDACQLEGAEQLVRGRDLALALEDLDLHGRLVVLSRGEGLRTLRRDGGVALDELGHYAALGLDAEGKRSDVEKQHVLDVATQHASLQSSAQRHNLVRVDGLVRLLAGQFLDQLGHGRHTGGAADQDHVVNVADGHAGILDHLVERALGAVQQVGGDLLELGAGQRLVQEQRVLLGVHGDVRQVDGGLLCGRQLNLGLLRSLAQTLHRHLVLGQVNAVLGLELVHEPLNDAVVPVVAAELVVAGGSQHLDNTVADFQQGHVEGAAAKVEDQDGLFLLVLVQAVSQSSRGRLVDNAQHIEARDLAGFLGGLTLSVLEVRRDGNNSLGDFLTEVRLSVALQLLQGTGGDLLRGVLLVVDLHGPVLAHVALDGADGAVDVGHSLVLRGLANQDLAVLRESDDGRGGAGALRVSDHNRLAALEDGDDRVRGAKVNTNCTCHKSYSSC